jgi:hypothetical protein
MNWIVEPGLLPGLNWNQVICVVISAIITIAAIVVGVKGVKYIWNEMWKEE